MKSRTYIGIYLMLLVLTPIINRGGIPWRLDDIFLLYLLINMYLKRRLSFSFPSVILLLFSVSTLLGSLVHITTTGTFALSNVNNVAVPIRMILIIEVVQYYVYSHDNILSVLSWLYGAIVVSLIVALIQYLRIEPFSAYSFSIYTGGSEKYEDMYYGIGIYRVVSVYGNANFTGFFFTIGLLLSIGFILQKSGTIIVHGVIAGAFFFASLFALSSRTSVVLMFIVSLFYVCLYVYYDKDNIGNRFRKILLISSLSALVLLIFLSIPFYMYSTRMEKFFVEASTGGVSGVAESTMESRGENWENVFDEIYREGMWLVGNGSPDFVIDSEYLYILYAQGLIGLSLLLILYAWPIVTFHNRISSGARSIATLIFVLFLAYIILGIVAPVFWNAKAGPLVAVLLGYWQVLLKQKPKSNMATSQ